MADLNSIVEGNIEDFNTNELYFDTLSIKKLVILSILTFGFYDVIWFYNTWKALAERFDYKISPLWRAMFCNISAFWLFPILEEYIEKFGINAFVGILFATCYFLLIFLGNLPDPWYLLALTNVIFIAIAQDKINKVNAQHFPNARENRWSVTNTIWAVICGIWFGFVLL